MADDRRDVLAGDSFPVIADLAKAMGFASAQPILRAATSIRRHRTSAPAQR